MLNQIGIYFQTNKKKGDHKTCNCLGSDSMILTVTAFDANYFSPDNISYKDPLEGN